MSAAIPYAIIAGLFSLVVFFAWRWNRASKKGAEGDLAKKDLKRWGEAIEEHHEIHSQPLEPNRIADGWRRLRNKNNSS